MKIIHTVLLAFWVAAFFTALYMFKNDAYSAKHFTAGVIMLVSFLGAIWSCVCLEKGNE